MPLALLAPPRALVGTGRGTTAWLLAPSASDASDSSDVPSRGRLRDVKGAALLLVEPAMILRTDLETPTGRTWMT